MWMLLTGVELKVPPSATSIESKPTNKLPAVPFLIVALSFGKTGIAEGAPLFKQLPILACCFTATKSEFGLC